MATFNHFDILAPYYDRFINPADPSRFSRLAGLPVAGLLLDVGGGTGQKSLPLREMVSGIVVADSSKGMLFQASKKVGLTEIRFAVLENVPPHSQPAFLILLRESPKVI